MRKTFINIGLVILTFGWLSSCTKEQDIFIPDAGQIMAPDSTWYSAVSSLMPVNDLKTSLQLRPSIDTMTLDGINPTTITSASGLTCTFPANSIVDSNGVVVTGLVNVESFLLQKKGDIIRMGLPTISDGNLLISRGVISIKINQGNTELRLADNANFKAAYTDSAVYQQPFQLFTGAATMDGQFNWSPLKDSLNYISIEQGNYRINCNQLKWINCDYFYRNNSGDTSKITITAKLPPYFTNVNTITCIVFNDIRSVMNMHSDFTSKKFISGRVPVGLNAKIVTVTKDGNFYYLGTKDFTTEHASADDGTQLVNVTPGRCSIDDINALLNSL